jgi:hypothetical protein
MELKRNQPKQGQYQIQNFDTRISTETIEALKPVDAAKAKKEPA